MKTVNLYEYDVQANEVEAGKINSIEVNKLMDKKFQNSKLGIDDFISAEDTISKTCFVLYRDDKDYLYVNFTSTGDVSFETTKLYLPSGLKAKILLALGKMRKSWGEEFNVSQAKIICTDYIEMTRQAFEAKYMA